MSWNYNWHGQVLSMQYPDRKQWNNGVQTFTGPLLTYNYNAVDQLTGVTETLPWPWAMTQMKHYTSQGDADGVADRDAE